MTHILTMWLAASLAHDGHDHPAGLRVWKDADGLFEIEAAFVSSKDGKVTLHKHDGKVVTLPLSRFSEEDQKFVREKLATIAALNAGKTVEGAAPADRAVLVASHFAGFPRLVTTRADAEFLYVESRGFPDHLMMVGISAWQQQVPLPQSYFGGNAWRIPLHPKFAEHPVSAKTALFRGAIAVAVNGVPIFNPIKNDGRTDTFLAGELDQFGGHCGRADDYHYHVAPVHLEKVVGKGNPIGYALDGYPLYGFTDRDGKKPKDLDEFNGRMEKDGYRYYSTPRYPYVNGGLRGEVTVREDQIDPQPRASPVRPAGVPLHGAKIVGFERDDEAKKYAVKYTLRNRQKEVRYRIADDGVVHFVMEDGTEETYRPRQRGDDPPRKKGKGKEGDRPPKRGKGGNKRGDDQPPPPPEDEERHVEAVKLTPKRSGRMVLSSPAFKAGRALPKPFTGDGAGETPPLEWKGAPTTTKSFALVMDHQARDGMKCYWILYDIPAGTRSLATNAEGVGKPGATWKPGEPYVPPHSQGPGTNTYAITLYALSESPAFADGAKIDRNALLTAIKDVILDSAELKFTYSRPEGGEDENPGLRKGRGKKNNKNPEDE